MNYSDEMVALVKKDRASITIMILVLYENGRFVEGKHDFFISLAKYIQRFVSNRAYYGDELSFCSILSDKQFEAVARSGSGFLRNFSEIVTGENNLFKA